MNGFQTTLIPNPEQSIIQTLPCSKTARDGRSNALLRRLRAPAPAVWQLLK